MAAAVETTLQRIPGFGWLPALTAPVPAYARRQNGPASAGSTGEQPAGSHRRGELFTLDPAEQLAFLVRDHSEAMYRVALSVARDADLAEDVTQDALLKAWQALPTFRGDAPLRNWVLRITHNTAISAIRKRREEVVDPAELPEFDSDPHGRVEQRVENRLSVAAFERALNDLDELSRSIVVLRELEGLRYEDIAELLRVPLPTVKTRLLRARRTLATTLEGWRP